MEFQSTLNILGHINTFDWFVFFFIALLTLASVIWGQLQKKTSSEKESFLDLMLMGRQLTLPMFVATLVATWYGGIFGVSQIAFENGIYNFVTQGVFWYVAYLIFAIFIIKKIAPYEALTLPDLIGKMFGPKSQKLSALFNLFNLVPIAYSISMGLFIQMLFGISLPISISIGVGFVLLYSLFGGFRAVVFSDIIQFFVMCSAVFLVFVISFNQFGFNLLFEKLPSSYFSPMGNYSLGQTLAWGLIALSTLVDPNFYQRSFAAKNFKIAKKGIFISTAIWITFDLCLTFGAMYAKAIIPDAASGQGYFIYAIQLLPHGLKGLMLAGVAATVLSTLDSYIFLAGSTLAYDLASKKYQGKVSIHHLGVLSVGILSIILAIVFEGDIKNVWKTLGSLSASALLIPVMAGYLFPNKLKDLDFIMAATLGAVTTFVWRLSPLKAYYGIDELYIGSLSCLIVIGLALMKRANS